MSRILSIATLALGAALLGAAQCGTVDSVAKVPPAVAASTSQPSAASSSSGVERRNPLAQCALLPPDIQATLGPLDGPPWYAKSMSDTAFWHGYEDGPGACMVRLAPRNGVPKGSIVGFEAIVDRPLAFETGAAEMNRAAKNMLDLIGAKTADGAQYRVGGWDYLGAYPREMTGRVGSIAVHADWGGVAVSLDSIERVIAKIRDRIPDYPQGAPPGPGAEAGDEDPCSLVTASEAESIYGRLLVPPYESRDLSGLVDENGTGCSYYFEHHHVVSIRPWWSNGKAVFNVIGATRPTGLDSYPHLNRPWDKEGADLVGNFYFLKGDKLLAVSWKTSDLSAYGAYKYAVFAMKKLAP